MWRLSGSSWAVTYARKCSGISCGCSVLERALKTLPLYMIHSFIRKGSIKRSLVLPFVWTGGTAFISVKHNGHSDQWTTNNFVWCTWEQTKYFSLYSIYNDKCFLFPVTCRECHQSCSCYLKEKMSKNVTMFSSKKKNITNKNPSWTISSNLRLVKLVSGVIGFSPVLL